MCAKTLLIFINKIAIITSVKSILIVLNDSELTTMHACTPKKLLCYQLSATEKKIMLHLNS